jgi:hypothetical protein
METYEVRVDYVTFLVEAEDGNDAYQQIQDMLPNIAFDWDTIKVEDKWSLSN